KYMGWSAGEPKSRTLDYKGWNGVLWIVKSLRAGQAVRCYLRSKDHYVGIVGCRGKKMHPEADDSDAAKTWEFLVMDPWAGGATTGSTTIQYAGNHLCSFARKQLEYLFSSPLFRPITLLP